MGMDDAAERDRRRLADLERELLTMSHTLRMLEHRVSELESAPKKHPRTIPPWPDLYG